MVNHYEPLEGKTVGNNDGDFVGAIVVANIVTTT